MNFIKICTDCGNEFETDKLCDETLKCNKCGSREIEQINKISYTDISPEECFIIYHKAKIACECNADVKRVILLEDD